MTILADRCPSTRVVDVRTQEELEVLTVFDILIERALTEVEELPELRRTIGCIVDVYL